jgi:DNA-binding LytR/AlgR family response regulator
MIRAIALEDEPPALAIIETFCGRIDFIELEKTFTNSAKARAYLESHPADLLFLDINMPALTGIEFYKSVPRQCMVIFTTSFSEYAVESYNLNAVDYLLKPYTFSRFYQAVEKARDRYKGLQREEDPEKEQYLVLKADYGLVKMALADILFIEGLDNYLKIHLQDQNPVVVRMTMKALLEKLPERHFIRVHRSYIVPFRRIESVRNKTIAVAGEEIPIGASYEENFLSLFRR